MQLILSQYLNDNATPEMVESIAKAYDVLELYGLQDMDSGYEGLIMMDEQYNTGDTLQAIIEMTTALQRQVLGYHAVTPSDDAPMDSMTLMITAILQIPDYSDMRSLLSIAMSEMSPLDAVSEIFAVVSGEPVEAYIINMEAAGGMLLARIKEIANKAVTGEIPRETTDNPQEQLIHNFRFYLSSIQQQPLLITEMLKAGTPVNLKFTEYTDRIGRDFEAMFPERIAQEMVGMAIISSDGRMNPRATIHANLENYITSVNVTTQVIIKVDSLLVGYKP